ncbi:MAG: hypothetical protein HFI72_01860 [Peptococcaceae bacterium]|jgi:uncharacterized membrane protein YvlD (DUF360 family)|nr:hypothetical protein [Peptococcaceae bacterium]
MSAFAWRLLINVIGIGLGFCVLPGLDTANFAGVFMAALLFGVMNGLLLPFFLLAKRQLNSMENISIFFGLSCLLDGILLIVAKMTIKGFTVTGFFNMIVMILLMALLSTLSSWFKFPERKKNG